MIDLTFEDFAEPPCKKVRPNDAATLLGVRVQLNGLVKRYTLNGKVGRVICWLAPEERYQVFVPKYEGGPLTLSVKPENLSVMRNTGLFGGDELQSLMCKGAGMSGRFPLIKMSLFLPRSCNDIRQHLSHQLTNPIRISEPKMTHIHDGYAGPLSRLEFTLSFC